MKRLAIELILILSLALTGCIDRENYDTHIKYVTIQRVEEYRDSNSLQDYELKWRAYMSDSTRLTFRSRPHIGDTVEYMIITPKNNHTK